MNEHLSIEEVSRLIFEEMDGRRLETLARAAHDLTVQRFGKTIKLYAPVYLSNSCINACKYCGFNRAAKISRVTLSADEAIKEADFLIAQGHRHILLVAGEDPNSVPLSYLENVARELRGRVAKLSIETQPFDEISYRRLFEAGVDGVTLYQETYDPETYGLMHPSGPKSNFASRLEAVENAGKAGMRFLGIGALLGLHDWRSEAVSLVRHARNLKKKFWQAAVAVSFPRIRDCASDFHMPSPISDRELVQMIVVLRLALPDADLVLSTREPAELRNRLIPIGITQMSAGSVTSPGGYTDKKQDEGPPATRASRHREARRAGEQFHIEDSRSPAKVAETISQTGYQPVWKDWI